MLPQVVVPPPFSLAFTGILGTQALPPGTGSVLLSSTPASLGSPPPIAEVTLAPPPTGAHVIAAPFPVARVVQPAGMLPYPQVARVLSMRVAAAAKLPSRICPSASSMFSSATVKKGKGPLLPLPPEPEVRHDQKREWSYCEAPHDGL